MTKSKATILGFLITPLVPALITVATGYLNGRSTDVLFLLGMILLLYIWAGIGMLFFASPIFLILNHFELINWRTSVLSGFLVGGILASILRLPNYPYLVEVVSWGLLGGFSAFCFWLIWRLGKPDF